MASKLLSQLAKHTQALINPVGYGHLRGKLNKKGFSEIAMYAAVARHCEENDISPFDMAKDMLALIKGCAESEFFIRVSNDFPYLRRQYNELRHGDIDKGEMKSAEQRGQFLCNTCHLVKPANEKVGKNYCCKICTKNKVQISQQKKAKETQAELPPAVELGKPEVTPKERPEPKPINIDALCEKKESVEVKNPEVIQGKTTSKDALFTITQVIGDTDETEFKIVCPTQNLPTVLGILKELQK